MTSLKRWSRSESTTLLKTPIFSIGSHLAWNHEKKGTFYTFDAPDWINVIAITKNEEIVVIYQYRHGTNKITLEIPGGVVDLNENPIDAAKRELQEETGYTSEEWISLGKTASNSAFMSNHTHLFLAKNCHLAHKQELDSMEEIEVKLVSKTDFFDLINAEEIDHSLILAGVCKWLLSEHK